MNKRIWLNAATFHANSMPFTGGRALLCLFIFGLCLSSSTLLTAQSTIAGTVVRNEATAFYTLEGVPTTQTASADFTVQEIIDVTVNWVDGANLRADTPELDVISRFEVANVGNGTEEFVLLVSNSSTADDFDFDLPDGAEIFIDDPVDGIPGTFDIEDDRFVDTVTIPPGTTISVFILTDIPESLVQGNLGLLDLTANANTSGAANADVGTVLAGLGDANTDAIVGATQATATDTAVHEITTVNVALTKTILSVTDTFGGDAFLPGSIVVYRIEVSVADGTAEGLIIEDQIPVNTGYVAESILLNELPLTDADDGDEASFNLTTNAVTVDLGDVADGSVFTIDLSVTID